MAIQTIGGLSAPIRKELADALLTELINGPNSGRELRFDADGRDPGDTGHGGTRRIYTATPLSFKGFVAVHRAMTEAELSRLAREQQRPVAPRGAYVFDVLPVESGFRSRPR
jgi:hypothetical protein